MLQGITWAQFMTGTALVTTAYYAVIGLVYFRQEFTAIVKGKKPEQSKKSFTEPQTAMDPLMPDIYELMASIKGHMQRAATQHYVVNETIFGLQHLIQQYPAIKASRFVPSINNEIIQLSNELLGQPFSADEITAIWN